MSQSRVVEHEAGPVSQECRQTTSRVLEHFRTCRDFNAVNVAGALRQQHEREERER